MKGFGRIDAFDICFLPIDIAGLIFLIGLGIHNVFHIANPFIYWALWVVGFLLWLAAMWYLWLPVFHDYINKRL